MIERGSKLHDVVLIVLSIGRCHTSVTKED